MAFVCVQTLLTSWARRSEDLTFDKTDEKDAVLIARLTAQLRCYGRDHRPEMGCGDRRRRQVRGDRTSRLSGGSQAGGRGEPHAASRSHGYLACHHGQPRPSSDQPDYPLLGPPQLRLCRDRRQARHRTKGLTQNRSYADDSESQ
jgi:hypothetical protein